jgi:hypothetical protein
MTVGELRPLGGTLGTEALGVDCRSARCRDPLPGWRMPLRTTRCWCDPAFVRPVIASAARRSPTETGRMPVTNIRSRRSANDVLQEAAAFRQAVFKRVLLRSTVVPSLRIWGLGVRLLATPLQTGAFLARIQDRIGWCRGIGIRCRPRTMRASSKPRDPSAAAKMASANTHLELSG